jgi:predicted CoA-binding protein
MAHLIPDLELRKLLQDSKTIAVIGLSPIASRPSYEVTRYLIKAGYLIFGVRPASPPEILSRPCVETLAQLAADIDIIDVFRNSDALSGLVDEIGVWMKSPAMAAKRKPKLLWLQEGVRNDAAEEKAEALGLRVISDRCILKEHARLI